MGLKVKNVVIKLPLSHLKDVCRYYEFPLAVLISSDVKLPKGTRKLHFDHKIDEIKNRIEQQRENVTNSIDKELTFTQATYYLSGLEFAEMKIEEVIKNE